LSLIYIFSFSGTTIFYRIQDAVLKFSPLLENIVEPKHVKINEKNYSKMLHRYKGMLKKYVKANRKIETEKLCMENTFLEKS
jgi:hypothetical protein